MFYRSAVLLLLLTRLVTGSPPERRRQAESLVTHQKLVTFEDVTKASGIQFRNSNSPTPEKYLIETMTGGVAVFDYDNDGWPDIFLVNGARIKSGQKDDEPLDKSSPDCWNRL